MFHEEAERLITRKYGVLDLHSPIFSFSDFSTYYERELGGHCWKYLVSLNALMPVDEIVSVKLFTEEVETGLADQADISSKRTVNIDPGFVNGWQVVLASVKNHGHRIYMAHGVYCEVSLLYRNREFEPLPWTYRDYVSPPVLAFLKEVRSAYRRQI
jgi:hypothetical protein